MSLEEAAHKAIGAGKKDAEEEEEDDDDGENGI